MPDDKVRQQKANYRYTSPVGKQLRPENEAAIKLLDEWTSSPDDKGEEWWAEFEKELAENRFILRRTC